MPIVVDYEARNKQTLKYISWYWGMYGFAPSYRSIGKAIGVKSTSTVHEILRHLESRGHISRNPVNHAVRVINTGDQETCVHDWRVLAIGNPLKLICADCRFTTEAEYDPPKDCDPHDLLKYTGKL